MPHILSSNALDLLFNQELTGEAIPKVTNNDDTVSGGTSTTITFTAKDLGKKNGAGPNAVMFLNLLEIINDPLLDTVTATYHFQPPTPKLKFTRTSRTSTIVLPSVFLPMTKLEIVLTARTAVDAGYTITTILDLMKPENARLYSVLGKPLQAELKELLEDEKIAAGSVPTVVRK